MSAIPSDSFRLFTPRERVCLASGERFETNGAHDRFCAALDIRHASDAGVEADMFFDGHEVDSIDLRTHAKLGACP